MQIRFEFDELTNPAEAQMTLVSEVWGHTEFNSGEKYLKFIARDFIEMNIAIKKIKPFIKK